MYSYESCTQTDQQTHGPDYNTFICHWGVIIPINNVTNGWRRENSFLDVCTRNLLKSNSQQGPTLTSSHWPYRHSTQHHNGQGHILGSLFLLVKMWSIVTSVHPRIILGVFIQRKDIDLMDIGLIRSDKWIKTWG